MSARTAPTRASDARNGAALTASSSPAGKRPDPDECPTPTKRRLTGETVYRAALNSSGNYGKPIRPYRCTDHWHLTSIPHAKDWT